MTISFMLFYESILLLRFNVIGTVQNWSKDMIF